MLSDRGCTLTDESGLLCGQIIDPSEGGEISALADPIEAEERQVQQLLAGMRRQEELRDRMPEAIDEFIQLDDEFHRMMYFFGGRGHTWLAMRGLVSHYDRMRYLDALDGECDYERVIRQHREFCDYLLMGLPDGVDPEQAIGAHLTSFRGNLMTKMALHPGYFTLQNA